MVDLISFIPSPATPLFFAYRQKNKKKRFKLLKKIIPFLEKTVEPDLVRKKYKNVLELCDNSPFCIIYKK